MTTATMEHPSKDVPANTTIDQIEALVKAQVEVQAQWANFGPDILAGYLDRILPKMHAVASEWVARAIEAKGAKPGSSGEAEEWLAGPYCILRNLRLLRDSLQSLAERGKVKLPGPAVAGLRDEVRVPVFPTDIYDMLMFMGSKAEVWVSKDAVDSNLEPHHAAYWKEGATPGLALVLGAGNVSSIGPMDVLYKMFVERKCAILKMHPVNAYVGPLIETAFGELIEQKFLAVVYGDVEEGKYLCNAPDVTEIHITGSDKTHDAIVYGPEVAANKEARKPTLEKPITSELGNVSPIIVVPGPWSESDLDFQAENIFSSLANNGGFNCNASRVLVFQKDWPGRQGLLIRLKKLMEQYPARKAYYPGAQQRHQTLCAAGNQVFQTPNNPPEGSLPWTIVLDVDPTQQDHPCFQMEAFCSLMCETGLEADSPADFLNKAVTFCNQVLWGTLNCTILIHPRSRRRPDVAKAFQEALLDLRYGTVSVNHWAAVCYAMVSTTWGAYPGHPLHDIRSGRDVVHNTYLLDEVLKSVVYGPFKPFPKPPWFCTHKNGAKLGPKLASMEAAPSLFKLPGITLSAL